jgi:hypothetical protein
VAIQVKGLSSSDFILGETVDGASLKRRGTNYGFLIVPTRDSDYEDPYYEITASPVVPYSRKIGKIIVGMKLWIASIIGLIA